VWEGGQEIQHEETMRNKHKHLLPPEELDESNVEKSICTICGMLVTKKRIAQHTSRCGLKKEGGQWSGGGQRVDKNLSCETCTRHFMSEEHLKEHKCAHLKCDL